MTHLDNAKRLLDVAESGDAKREAYRAAAEEVAAHKAETGDSETAIGIALGRSRQYVNHLLRWHNAGYVSESPFQSEAAQAARDKYEAKRTLSLPVEKRAELAAELLADPDVVREAMPKVLAGDEKAARVARQAARDREHTERMEERAQNQKHNQTVGTPGLDPIVWHASVRMSEWALAIDGMHAEFRALRDGPGKDALISSTEHVIRSAQRMLAALRPENTELGEFADVIDIDIAR